MKLVGGDIGAYEREEYIDNLVIAPAERYIIDIYASESGEYTITNQMKDGSYTMGTIVVSNDQVGTSYESVFNTLNSYDEVMSDIDQYRKYFDRPIDKTLSLDIQMDGMTGQMPMTQDDHASGTSADMIALP
jgi:FtsP/CotA-like multicopper oxidase with cupredoxin domain